MDASLVNHVSNIESRTMRREEKAKKDRNLHEQYKSRPIIQEAHPIPCFYVLAHNLLRHRPNRSYR
jgi:hypothetical protein